jgi:molybdenum storage protein
MSQITSKTDDRNHLSSGLMRESLVSKKLIGQTKNTKVRTMVPDLKMIAIGGQSIMDRGKEAIMPLIDEIVAIRKQHKIIVGVGGGARARHTFSIGLDLGLPIGGLARIVGGVEENNRDILQFLLAPYGGITFVKDHLQDIQMFLKDGLIPICIGQPPYHFWEPPSREKGSLPDNGPDVGLFLMAEVMGAENMILVKDVDGIFDKDPHKYSDAVLIKEATAESLLNGNYDDLPIERELLRSLTNARTLKSIQVVNGLKPNNILNALNGKHVGTIIHAVAVEGENS